MFATRSSRVPYSFASLMDARSTCRSWNGSTASSLCTRNRHRRRARWRRYRPRRRPAVRRGSARLPRVHEQHFPHRRRRPARAYIDELLPLVLDDTIEPGGAFDRTIGLDGAPAGYKAVADREALGMLVRT